MRNMSFSKTTDQIRNRTKDVTRRMGWSNLLPGERFWAVEKAMGLKKGEKIVRLYQLECLSNTAEPLKEITGSDVIREGFHCTSEEFISFFCKLNHCNPDSIVNRIEFKYLDPEKKELPDGL